MGHLSHDQTVLLPPPRRAPAGIAPGPGIGGYHGCRGTHRGGHGAVRGDGEPPLPERCHRPPSQRLAGHAPGQRLDRGAVPQIRPDRGAGAVRLRGHLGARAAVAPHRGAVRPGDHRTQLGLDRRDRRQGAEGAGGAGGPVQPGQPGPLPRPGQRRLGAAGALQAGPEPRRATADGGGLPAGRRDAGRPGVTHRRHDGAGRAGVGGSSRSTSRTCSRRPAPSARWWTAARSTG